MNASMGINGGTPNDCDPVSSWTDQSPSANIFTQVTFANQPLWKQSGVNGQPYIKFSSPSFLSLNFTDLFPSNTDELTVFMVLRKTAPPTGGQFSVPFIMNTAVGSFFSPSLNSWRVQDLHALGGDYESNFGTGTTIDDSFGPTSSSATVLTLVKSATDAEVRRDGSSLNTKVGANITQEGTHHIGRFSNAGRAFEGEFYEILCYDGKLSPVEVDIVEDYLTSKYAI
jgi:hypothetical protein